MEIKKLNVKNAVAVFDSGFFYVVHYDTIILKLEVNPLKVLKILPVSDSSDRAIMEALNEKLGFSYEYIHSEIYSKVEELNGIPKNELVKMWKYKRYSQPERRTKSQLEQTVKRLIGAEI